MYGETFRAATRHNHNNSDIKRYFRARKSTKTLGLLRCNLALAPRHTKEAAYKTLVRPQLEYATPMWHPCSDTETDKVEKVLTGGPANDGGTRVASTICWANASGHPWRTAG